MRSVVPVIVALSSTALFVSAGAVAQETTPVPSASSVPPVAAPSPVPVASATPIGSPPPSPSAPGPSEAGAGDAKVQAPWVTAGGPGTWSAQYVEARAAMLAGRFIECRSVAEALVAQSGTATERALATELAHVCGTLAVKDYTFVRRQDLGDSTVAQRATGIRTTDELVLLYSNAVVWGIGTGGWIAVLAEPREPAGIVLPMLGIGGLAATLVWVADRGKGLPYGVPQSMVSGLYLGFYEGLAWTLWNQARSRRVDLWEASTIATIIWGTATAGAIAGAVIGGSGTTPGRAAFVESTGLWSGVLGGLFAAALYGKDDRSDGRDDAALLTGALALNAGAIGGALLARTVSPTIARVRFLDLGGIAGGLVAGGLYWASLGRRDDANVVAVTGLTGLGIAAGLTTAWFLTTDLPRDEPTSKPVAASFAPTVMPVHGGATLGIAGVL
ncbi:MAG: hypothetical protein JNL79_11720 [Myxococcales bacterium]|nr:hypothetical protein [Myxococcales bacterium]